jgi:hypothetical protein
MGRPGAGINALPAFLLVPDSRARWPDAEWIGSIGIRAPRAAEAAELNDSPDRNRSGDQMKDGVGRLAKLTAKRPAVDPTIQADRDNEKQDRPPVAFVAVV